MCSSGDVHVSVASVVVSPRSLALVTTICSVEVPTGASRRLTRSPVVAMYLPSQRYDENDPVEAVVPLAALRDT